MLYSTWLEMEQVSCAHMLCIRVYSKVYSMQALTFLRRRSGAKICTVALRGTSGVWRSAVADITADVEDIQQIFGNLGRVKRTVAPNSQATVLLMRTMVEGS